MALQQLSTRISRQVIAAKFHNDMHVSGHLLILSLWSFS
jgi:hypothetical protein